MKPIKTLLCILALSFMLPQVAEAGRASSLAQAYQKAGDKPIVAFVYGANFSNVNDEAYYEFMKRRKLMRGLPSCIYVDVPIYQDPTEKEQKEWDKALGGAAVPSDGVWTLPCVLILDGKANTRGYIRDLKDMKDPETANAILKEKLKAFDTQQKYLEKAAKSKTKRRFEYLAKASVLGLDIPKDVLEAATSAPLEDKLEAAEDGEFLPKDIDDASDYQKVLIFNKGMWEELLLRIDRMSIDEADTYLRSQAENEHLSIEQKQELLCALSGHVRRSGGTTEQMRKVYQDIMELNPDSMFGLYAQECIYYYCDKIGNDEKD